MDINEDVSGKNHTIDFLQILRGANIVDLPVDTDPSDANACISNPVQVLSPSTFQADFTCPDDQPAARFSVNDPVSLDSSSGARIFPSPPNMSTPVQAMRCADDSISVHVPEALRGSICRGEYTNLALLLKGALELNDLCTGGTLRLTAEGVIESRPKECKDTIRSIEGWTNAFIIYMSVYISVHTDKAAALLQYMYNIRDCAARQGGLAWKNYDEQFRMRQAVNPVSWSTIHNELWWRCVQVRDAQQPAVTTGKSYSCHEFNNGTCHWPSCRFPHVCSGCGLAHRVVHCPTARLGTNAQSQYASTVTGEARQGGSFRGQSRGFQRGRGQSGARRRFTRGYGRRSPY